MAPNRPNSKKGKQEEGKKKRTPGSLLADAETQYEVGNLDEAIELASQALDLTGEGGDFELKALNCLGIYFLEVGDVEEAKDFFERAVKLDEEGSLDEKIGGGPEKFLFLAQLSEEGGQDSVRWFERGAAALRRKIQILTETGGSNKKTPEQQEVLEETQNRLGGVLCAVAEVYMTDLSWEEDAEQRCEALITEAMMIAPSSAETWQTVANVRISQERVDEARGALKQSLGLWQDLSPEHPKVPDFPTRVSLARLLMETEMEEQALVVLERLVTDDDTSVEVWYLGGWCLYVAGEKLRAAREKQHEEENGEAAEEWKSTWRYSRKWLSQCLKLYEQQEYEDERLGQHAAELLESVNNELGEPPEDEDEEEWEGISDDDDEHDHEHEHEHEHDGDEEMEG